MPLCSKPVKQTPVEDEVHFITRCDSNEFFNEIMLLTGYTDEKQYIILMKMDSKEDDIELAKFICLLFKKRESIINRQKALLDSLTIILDSSQYISYRLKSNGFR